MFGKSTRSERGSHKRGSSTTTIMSQHPLSQPAMEPGCFGDFPEDISVYYSGMSEDKKSRYFFLAEDTNAQDSLPKDETGPTADDEIKSTPTSTQSQSITPRYAFEIHQGMVKHQITLHDGPTCNDRPLALGGNESSFRSTPIIGMPRENTSPVGNKIVPIDQSSKGKDETWTFASPTSTASLESFQWCCVDDEDSMMGTTQRVLVRTNPGPNLPEEIVGTWTAGPMPIIDDTPNRDSAPVRLGTFAFEGAGRDGELGANWRLMAIMTLLRMNQTRWESLNPLGSVDGMRMKAGKLLGAGVEFGFEFLVGGAAS